MEDGYMCRYCRCAWHQSYMWVLCGKQGPSAEACCTQPPWQWGQRLALTMMALTYTHHFLYWMVVKKSIIIVTGVLLLGSLGSLTFPVGNVENRRRASMNRVHGWQYLSVIQTKLSTALFWRVSFGCLTMQPLNLTLPNASSACCLYSFWGVVSTAEALSTLEDQGHQGFATTEEHQQLSGFSCS